MNRQQLPGIILMLIALLFASCTKNEKITSNTSNNSKFVFKLAHNTNEHNTWHLGVKKFAELVAAKSQGRVEIKIFPNEQLGKEADVVTSIQMKAIDMMISGETLQKWAPKAMLLGVPYAVSSLEHLEHIMASPVGMDIEKEILEKTQLRPLFWYARGPRNLTSNRPIHTPQDLKGILLRVPEVPLFVNVWAHLGAKPTPMAFSEVFTGLQQGTIEAQENPLALIETAAFYSVQKYVNRTEHVRSWIYVLIGEKQYQSLPDDLKTIFAEAGTEAQTYERQLFLAEEQNLENKLQQRGMTFVDVDKAAFEAQATEAVKIALPPGLQPLYEQILSLR